ncbi:YbcC family protein [Chromobacterium haemolyticum]|uniref:YbcC family protein n=1 Tax=Chromobacterium haemolyticum TaxID=394935 RepID=UPI0040572E33
MTEHEQAIARALAAIAPAWPLDSLVASSPYWGLRDQPFHQAADTLRQAANSPLHLPQNEYMDAWRRGEISPDALEVALSETGWTDGVQAWLDASPPQSDSDSLSSPGALATYHREAAGPLNVQSWTDVVIQQISQYCAAWFDRDQANWHLDHEHGFYAAWLEQIRQPYGLSVLPERREQIRLRAEQLPGDAEAMLTVGLTQLQPESSWLTTWLQALLIRNNGWAAWCAYLNWQAGLNGETDGHLRQLLAIQIAWECLLDDGMRAPDSPWAAWRRDWDRRRHGRADARLLSWQRAHELALHGPLTQALCRESSTEEAMRPAMQAVFCIDVRSEPLRRALEETIPESRTHGFAGFFGLPLAYRVPGSETAQPRLPVLLAPGWEASTPLEPKPLTTRHGWQTFQRLPLSGFALVESAGLGKLAALIRRSKTRSYQATLPQLDPWLTTEAAKPVPQDRLDLEKRVEIVSGLLPAMGLSGVLAPWVLLTGHASHASNNPQAAALQCGACGGHGGHQHVRLLANWLNDPALRARLAEQGQSIPADTVFLPALHLTHSDEILLLDTDALRAEAHARLPELQAKLRAASALARRRRAPLLGLEPAASDSILLKKMRQKGDDWAETRTEWALAGNALFIAALRAKTRKLDLGGRAFLHEYDWRADPDGKGLQAILAAPMVVAHWINMQYFASTVDPRRFGSGNKLLHNVVGGRIGVFEGNSGDLRIGLAWQSVHDGQRLRHAPLRLAACIDAPPDKLAEALAAQPIPRQLAENGWLHLYCVHGDTPLRWHADGEWKHD